jgi:signal transduction histidine kinase/CheY-like chemotaxis protein
MTERPLYNSRIMNTYVKLIRRKYPQVDLRAVLKDAGIESYEVSDEGHWFTQEEANRFFDNLVLATGNPGIAREAGQFGASVESTGIMRKYLGGLIGAANAFSTIRKSSAILTRSSIYESRKIASNMVEITVTPAPDVQERLFQCENRVGFFEAILTTFDCSNPLIEHLECMFQGDPVCRYRISWKETLPNRIRAFRNRFALVALAVCAVGGALRPWETATLGAPLAALLLLTCSYCAERLEKKELHNALSSLRESTDELLDQTWVNYNNALMVNEVGQAISKQAGIDEVLENVIRALKNRLSYDRGLILLADPDKKTLGFRIGFGYSEQQFSLLQQTSFNLGNPESKGVFVTCFRDQKPVLINDFSAVSGDHSPHSQLFAEKIGAQSFLCCAIVCEGEALGVLALDNIKTKKPLVQSDVSLLTGIAPVIGMSLRNALYIDRERHRAEQMRQSQRMEAVGQLAGGIAHDFNNLLTAIIGFTSLAQMDLGQGDPAARHLDEVLVASERASHLTKGLLSFSRKQPVNLQPIELNGSVERIEKLLRRLISEEIELVLRYAGEPLPVIADAGQIDQIIMNLATNARDAMEHSGTLTIETGSREITADFVPDYGCSQPGRYARLSVSDTGKGMDEATRARIFEPFFTTKEVGKGTGLGLAIVYGIVKQHDGFLDIESTPGRGTSFSIYLPLPGTDAVPELPDEQPATSHRGAGTVLVVEDAPEVRRLTRQVLESSGYRVVEAEDGADALEKFRAHQDQIKLVIMDVVMPKMNGKEAFAEISLMRPGTKVLFTSGYTPNDVSRKGVHFDRDNFIGKPCRPQELLKRVAELLAEP